MKGLLISAPCEENNLPNYFFFTLAGNSQDLVETKEYLFVA